VTVEAGREADQVLTYIVVSVGSGVLFGILDGVINGNPLARRLNEVYKPIARTALNLPAGIAIDLAYGFAMAGIYLLIWQSLPGATGLVKGLFFGLLAWFFRVAMSAASQWMTLRVPVATLLYGLATGLVEMLVVGVLYGLTLTRLA
jgi:hypothetical protein